MKLTLALATILFMTLPADAARYDAHSASEDGIGVYKLTDAKEQIEVSVVPSIGNIAYRMTVKGHSILFSPYKTLRELKEKPTLMGVPFLAPWANRLDQGAFYANGQKFTLNPNLHNYRNDGSGLPIHGLLNYASEWKMIGIGGGEKAAYITCRLEFFRFPEYMAQFPFAHTIDMTYRLADGALEVETEITNVSFATMPLSIGYHPYFTLDDAPRTEWKVTLPAKEQVVLNDKLTPTGETKPNAMQSIAELGKTSLDNVFSGLIPDSNGRAEFAVAGKSQKISVLYGPKYPVAVVYAPLGPNRDFICFEPMTGVTNAFNLAHEGKYAQLQTIPAGGVWKESFWIRPSGF